MWKIWESLEHTSATFGTKKLANEDAYWVLKLLPLRKFSGDFWATKSRKTASKRLLLGNRGYQRRPSSLSGTPSLFIVVVSLVQWRRSGQGEESSAVHSSAAEKIRILSTALYSPKRRREVR